MRILLIGVGSLRIFSAQSYFDHEDCFGLGSRRYFSARSMTSPGTQKQIIPLLVSHFDKKMNSHTLTIATMSGDISIDIPPDSQQHVSLAVFSSSH